MAEDSVPVWRGVAIADAVKRCESDMVARGIATTKRGYRASVLSAADGRLGRPMPPELREFYARVTPVSECPEAEYGLVCFQPADDPDLTWLESPEVRDEKLWVVPEENCWLKGWADARLLVIGYTPFGDCLLWSEGLERYPAGTIVLTDHESDENPVVLGESLSEWLARYHAFGLVEYAIAPAGLDDLDPQDALSFLRDHLRLNPYCKWAKKKLLKLEKP